MSQADQKENVNPAKTMVPSSKAAVASPKLSADEHVEMSDLPSGPLAEEDIMHLARLGDIPAIQKLFDDGKFDAKYCDDEGITPLHVIYSYFFSAEIAS
jgi:palmitoyltransferase ZDHHC13/17